MKVAISKPDLRPCPFAVDRRAHRRGQARPVVVLAQPHVDHAAERLGIDERGLDRVDRKALKLLLVRGRPMGIGAIASRLGMDLETFRDVHEPWLERSGLIERTEWGRMATEEARKLYGEDADAGRTGGPGTSESPAPVNQRILSPKIGSLP